MSAGYCPHGWREIIDCPQCDPKARPLIDRIAALEAQVAELKQLNQAKRDDVERVGDEPPNNKLTNPAAE